MHGKEKTSFCLRARTATADKSRHYCTSKTLWPDSVEGSFKCLYPPCAGYTMMPDARGRTQTRRPRGSSPCLMPPGSHIGSGIMLSYFCAPLGGHGVFPSLQQLSLRQPVQRHYWYPWSLYFGTWTQYVIQIKGVLGFVMFLSFWALFCLKFGCCPFST